MRWFWDNMHAYVRPSYRDRTRIPLKLSPNQIYDESIFHEESIWKSRKVIWCLALWTNYISNSYFKATRGQLILLMVKGWIEVSLVFGQKFAIFSNVLTRDFLKWIRVRRPISRDFRIFQISIFSVSLIVSLWPAVALQRFIFYGNSFLSRIFHA